MNFDEAVRYLLGLGHETLAMKLGLRNTELLLEALDNPERSFRSVQIAGTNGKGSAAAMLDSIARAAGLNWGLYTSPHLISITERIKLSGNAIAPEQFAACATIVRNVSEQLLRDKQIAALPTFFEQLTPIALLAFRNAGIDLAILETGLGGRLDSTTVAKAGIVAITQIAMDHEEYLGHTLATIAGEKAAIIRPGVTAVIARQTPEAMDVLLRRCDESGVVPIVAGIPSIAANTSDGRFCITLDTSTQRYEKVWLGLRGRHQIDNAAVAIHLAEALQLPQSAIVSGLQSARHPGRLELIPSTPPLLLDGAHNPAGCRALREYLEGFAPRPLTLIFGAMRDKRFDQIGEILFSLADVLVLTPVANPRSAPVEMLRSIADRFARGTVIETQTSTAALETACEQTPLSGLICVAGSLYLIGELLPAILHRLEKQR